MTPRRAADRGTAATLAGSESLGEVATPTCPPWVGPGCDDRPLSRRRWPRPCACPPAAGAPLHSACSHRGLRCHPAGPPTAAARHTARRGPGSRPRCFGSEVPGLLHAGVAGHERMDHVQAQHVGRRCSTPHGHLTPAPIDQDAAVEPHDQMGQLRRDAVIDVLQLLPSKMLGQPRLGADSGGLDLPGHHWAASSAGGGCAPPGSPVAAPALAGPRCSATVITHRVLARPCGLRRRLSWPVLV
jgi:hypothetical protein